MIIAQQMELNICLGAMLSNNFANMFSFLTIKEPQTENNAAVNMLNWNLSHTIIA